MNPQEESRKRDFVRDIIDEDLAQGKNNGQVVTRFPPEPNGYLHIGHAKAISLDFGVARDYNGRCHLRFDDTNPENEELEYINSIQEDVRWLGFDWGSHLYYASDYYEKFCAYALELIRGGKAYVCDLTPPQVKEYRGTPTEPGKDSPFRGRTAEENLALFEKMRSGALPEGACTLRAKIDMAHPNITMRDPALYRIKFAEHPRTGKKWCIYPMYDFAHPISDALEGITHSICTLEFEEHRPLYNWVLDNITVGCHPRQIEFARLNLTYTIMSKRKLLQLVREKYVSGWDDPRMPTLSGLRRRGFTPEAVRNFCDRIGVDKTNSTIDLALLEYFIREDLNKRARRVMAVLRPLKVVIDNYPEGQTEKFDAENNPEDASAGTRKLPFSRVLYIEQDDFREVPPKKFFRLSPGREVRLKHAYYITCQQVVKDEKTGEIQELRCTYDPASRGGGTADNRKVEATLHWVSAPHAVDARVRLYDRLFVKPNPDETEEGRDFTSNLNPNSLEELADCKAEPGLGDAKPGERFQFLRQGYFCADRDCAPGKPVFNRTVTLRDTWAKIEAQQGQKKAK
ncbi:MAG: glutamine--tRNA ligase/YqeY domain fusion protein [Endomicrobiales bacterium]